MGWGYRGEECDTGPGPPGWDREETGLPWGTGVGAVVGDSPDWSEIIIMKIFHCTELNPTILKIFQTMY